MLKVRATPTREGAAAYRPAQGRDAVGADSLGIPLEAPLVVRNWLVAAKRS